jgi:tetratricopeptide (TPR) repeat protein
MTLRLRIRLIWMGLTVVALVLCYQYAQRAGRDPFKVALVALVPLVVMLLAIQVTLVRRGMRALDSAAQRGDVAAVERHLRDLAGFFSGRTHALLRLNQATALMVRERHGEALATLEALDRAALGEDYLPLWLAHAAWCAAMLGKHEQAIEQAGAALAQASAAPAPLRATCLGAQGAARVQTGEAELALELLRTSLELGVGQPRLQAARAYFLGEALAATGQRDAAAEAWRRARSEAPESKFAAKAAERL